METAESPALLLLDLPPSALAGIDLLSFTTTPRFRGVKHLPSGWHFAFVGTSTAFSERHGLWFEIKGTKPPLLIVAKWDAGTETLLLEQDEAELLRWRANLGSIWREGLTPYRQMTLNNTTEDGDDSTNTTTTIEGDWPVLTSSITPSLLSRVLNVTTTTPFRITSASSSHQDLETIPGLSTDDLNLATEQELFFLPIDLKRTWRAGATGRERTDAAQDRSWALENLIANHCTGGKVSEVIGELQFCFIMVLTLNNFSCLEQWKRILELVFTCRDAVTSRSDFFVSLIAALRLQLQHCKDAEGGLIDLADDSGSLLKVLLSRFRKNLESMRGSLGVQEVLDELDDLEEYLSNEYGWQFGGTFAKLGTLELEDGEQVDMDTTAFDEEDETGEFAPQVVELTREQAKMLNLSGGAGSVEESLQSVKVRQELEGSDESSDEDGADISEESEAGDLESMDARY